MEWYESLGKTIKKELNEKGISQREFVKKIGINEANFSKYLKGEKTPQADTLIKISKGLNCSLDYLLGLSKTKYIEPTDDEKAIIKISELTGLKVETLEWLINLNKDCQIFLNKISQEPIKEKYTGLPNYNNFIYEYFNKNGLVKNGIVADINAYLYYSEFLSLITFLNYYVCASCEPFLFSSLYEFLIIGNDSKNNNEKDYFLDSYSINTENGNKEISNTYSIDPTILKTCELKSIEDTLNEFTRYIHEWNEENNKQ